MVAHELGHIANRDPTRIALRSAGSTGMLGLLLGDFAGDAPVLHTTERLIQAPYGKEAERRADALARETRAKKGIKPSLLAGIFKRLLAKHGEDDGFGRHIRAHPAMGNRIAQAEVADSPRTGILQLVLYNPQ